MNRIALGLIAGAMTLASMACSHQSSRSSYVGGGPSGQENLYPTEYNAPPPYGGNVAPGQQPQTRKVPTSSVQQSTGGGPTYQQQGSMYQQGSSIAPSGTMQNSAPSGRTWYDNAR